MDTDLDFDRPVALEIKDKAKFSKLFTIPNRAYQEDQANPEWASTNKSPEI